MLDFLGNIFGAIASGGITGLIGTGITAFIEHKKQKAANEHEEKMVALEQQTIKLEAEMAVKKTEAQYAGETEVAEANAFATSFSTDKATFVKSDDSLFTKILFTIVDFVRGMTRPILTFYLCSVTTWMGYKVYVLSKGIQPAQAYALLNNIIYVVLYLTTTCCLWWFGTRNHVFKKTL